MPVQLTCVMFYAKGQLGSGGACPHGNPAHASSAQDHSWANSLSPAINCIYSEVMSAHSGIWTFAALVLRRYSSKLLPGQLDQSMLASCPEGSWKASLLLKRFQVQINWYIMSIHWHNVFLLQHVKIYITELHLSPKEIIITYVYSPTWKDIDCKQMCTNPGRVCGCSRHGTGSSGCLAHFSCKQRRIVLKGWGPLPTWEHLQTKLHE